MARSNTEEFTIRVKGEVTGEEWFGKFTVKKRLSFNDQFRSDNLRRQMLGPAEGTPTERVASTAIAFSELMVRVVEAPSWWTDNDNGRNLADEAVVIEVYKQAMDVEKRAFDEVHKAADKATEDLKTAVEST